MQCRERDNAANTTNTEDKYRQKPIKRNCIDVKRLKDTDDKQKHGINIYKGKYFSLLLKLVYNIYSVFAQPHSYYRPFRGSITISFIRPGFIDWIVYIGRYGVR